MLQMGLIYPQLLLNICKIKEELQIGCIRIYLIFPNLRGAEPGPKPRKIEIFNWFPE